MNEDLQLEINNTYFDSYTDRKKNSIKLTQIIIFQMVNS